jgi:hypothetical protein
LPWGPARLRERLGRLEPPARLEHLVVVAADVGAVGRFRNRLVVRPQNHRRLREQVRRASSRAAHLRCLSLQDANIDT